MRISTNMLFELGSSRISSLQASLVKTQQQLSTQRRVLTPADDPVAAATELGISQSLSMNEQFGLNRQTAKSMLGQEESVLQGVTDLLHGVKSLIVTAGNGAIEDEQRQYLAAELRGRFDQLLGLANSRDGTGNYMFGGFNTASQPFSQTPTGAQYNGDQGQRLLQVGSSRQLPLNDTGNSIFEGIRTGNRSFVTAPSNKFDTSVSPPVPVAPATANSGAGIIGTGAVVDATKLTGHDYSVVFSVIPSEVPTTPHTPDRVSYAVQDNVTGLFWNSAASTWGAAPPAPVPGTVPPAPWSPYASGQAITFDGLQIDVTGKPGDGDAFAINPSRNQSIFTTLNDLLTTLNMGSTGAAGSARLTNGLNAANNNIDNALDNVLNVRAAVGTRLGELDVLDSGGKDLNVQYTESLRALTEIDLAETFSSFTQQQMTLEAAQKSFISITRISLFDHI
jgi:flagellar hook-associated protein 3 FlgL